MTLPSQLSKLHPANKNLTDPLQPRHKHPQQTRNEKMTNGRPDIQPTPLIPHHVKKIQRQHVPERDHDHEQRARRDAQATVQHAEGGGHDGKGGEELEHEQGALGEGVEDGDEAVDCVEGEGRDGGDVAGAEEGALQEEEEEEGGAGVGEGEGAVGGGCCRGGGGGGDGGFPGVVLALVRGCCGWGGDLVLLEELAGSVGLLWVFAAGCGDEDVVFHADPGRQCQAEAEVEEAFVGDCEDDEDGGEGEEHDDQPVEIVVVWLDAVEEGDREG